MKQHPAVFPPKFVSFDLFDSVYSQVCTRCFSQGTESAAMIPMADNVNHSCADVNQEMVSVGLHLSQLQHPSYYRIYKMMNDYSILLGENNQNVPKEIKGRFDRQAFSSIQKVLSMTNVIQKVVRGDKEIWQVPFYVDTCDNEDESEDESDEDKPGNLLEQAILKERELQKAKIANSGVSKLDQFKALLEGSGLPDKAAAYLLKQNEDGKFNNPNDCDLRLTADSLAALEYIPIDQTCELQQREQSWLAGGDDEESEEDLDWLENLQADKRDNETYFSFINESRHVLKAGSQAYNCYGNRSNKYLMLSYNFCFEENYHDTFVM